MADLPAGFIAQKVIGALLMPLPVAALLVVTGWTLRRAGKMRVATAAMSLAVIVALAATCGAIADVLLGALERRYPAVLDARVLDPVPQLVVVLGSGYRPRAGLPVTAALSADSVVRLAEGIRLYRQLPHAMLVVSGGAGGSRPSSAVGYAAAATELGVQPERIILFTEPLDTSAEIRKLRATAGDRPVLLVTSAAHMPRAMVYCALYGVRATAAPTGHLSTTPDAWGWYTWLPSSLHLRKTEIAAHEYAGLLALRLGIE